PPARRHAPRARRGAGRRGAVGGRARRRARELAGEDVPADARADAAIEPAPTVLTWGARAPRPGASDCARRGAAFAAASSGRAAASFAVGLAIGVTPLWGVHWLLVAAVCVPLRLDAGVAFLASNVSLPFVAPFITFAEIELGARVLRGTWLAMTPPDVERIS